MLISIVSNGIFAEFWLLRCIAEPLARYFQFLIEFGSISRCNSYHRMTPCEQIILNLFDCWAAHGGATSGVRNQFDV